MNTKEIFKLAQNQCFIPEIYNYCDYWCEKCPFTLKCINYAVQQHEEIDNENINFFDENIVKKGHLDFDKTKELLEKFMEHEDVDFDEYFDEQHDLDDFYVRKNTVENNELIAISRQYNTIIDDWFEKETKFFEVKENEIRNSQDGKYENKDVNEVINEIKQAIEIIRWYQPQITSKLLRALPLWDSLKSIEIQNDANGSAKVALIEIGHSIDAWILIVGYCPEITDGIINNLLILDRLKKMTLDVFPHAMEFKRPGFDDVEDKNINGEL